MIEILLVQSFFWITRWNLQYRHDKTADKSGWPDSMNEELFVCPLTDWLDCPLSSQGSILSAMADVCFALKLKRYFRLVQTLMYSLLYKNNFQIFWQKLVLMRGIHLSSVFVLFIRLCSRIANMTAARKLILTLNIQCNSQCQLFLTIMKIFSQTLI